MKASFPPPARSTLVKQKQRARKRGAEGKATTPSRREESAFAFSEHGSPINDHGSDNSRWSPSQRTTHNQCSPCVGDYVRQHECIQQVRLHTRVCMCVSVKVKCCERLCCVCVHVCVCAHVCEHVCEHMCVCARSNTKVQLVIIRVFVWIYRRANMPSLIGFVSTCVFGVCVCVCLCRG